MGYQTHPDSPGASRSPEKLRALKLTSRLVRDRSVLDVGCNAGFFCDAMVKAGASRVVGIDSHPSHIDEARRRYGSVAEFRVADWWDLPPGEFDVILFLSAFHYERRKVEFLQHLRSRMSRNGVLVLEIGVVAEGARRWVPTTRAGGRTVLHPTNTMIRELLGYVGFAWSLVGPSVSQAGDPVPRRVYHCYRQQQSTVILIQGESGHGKTTLSYQFHGDAIHLDRVLLSMADPIAAAVKPLGPGRLAEVVSLISRTPAWRKQLINAVMQLLKRRLEVHTVVEGYLTPLLWAELTEALHDAGYRVWKTTREFRSQPSPA